MLGWHWSTVSGIEPRTTECEAVTLPLHYGSRLCFNDCQNSFLYFLKDSSLIVYFWSYVNPSKKIKTIISTSSVLHGSCKRIFKILWDHSLLMLHKVTFKLLRIIGAHVMFINSCYPLNDIWRLIIYIHSIKTNFSFRLKYQQIPSSSR